MFAWIKNLLGRWFPKKGAVKPVRKKAARQPKEHFGAHYYLGDLLNHLDSAFKDFRAFKKADREAYGLYKHLGASVFSSDVLIGRKGWGFVDLEKLPSFFCCYFPWKSDDPEAVRASFRYMLKIKKPVNVQPSNGTVYRVGGVYSADDKVHVAGVFYVAVSGDGTVTPLKQLELKSEVPHFTRQFKGDRGPVVQRARWDYPRSLWDIAQDSGTTIEDVAHHWFYTTAEASLAQNAGITVRARKGVDVATFAIDMLRTPYFFADRDKVVNENGRTKKILHIVRGHYRTLAGGERKFVKSHFRGLRKFTWNGYRVSIGLSGWHHTDAAGFQAPGVDVPECDKPVLTLEQVGERFAGVIE